MAPVVMWSGYVYQKTGRFEVSNGSMLSIHDGLIRNDGHKLNRFEVSQDAKREHAQNKLNNLKDVALFYLKELQSKPADAIKFIFFKAFRPWYAADSELYEKRIALIQLPYLMFGFWGLLRIYQKDRPGFYLFTGLILYFWFTAFMVLSILRYMMIPMAILMMGVAVTVLDKKAFKSSN